VHERPVIWELLQVLDEPAAVQSDPTLLNLQLRQLSKDTPGVRMEVVGCIEHGDKDRRQRLASWISSIADLHKNKPAAAVHYSRPMPDLEVLMQEWPPELETALRSSKLPTADLVRNLVHADDNRKNVKQTRTISPCIAFSSAHRRLTCQVNVLTSV
jgi:hypothetical protein